MIWRILLGVAIGVITIVGILGFALYLLLKDWDEIIRPDEGEGRERK